MFDIGFSELVLIGLVALIVLGPKRLQEAARTAGRWTARLRRFVDDVKRDMDAEMRRDELAELRKVQQEITDTKQYFEQTATATLASIPVAAPSEPVAAELVSTPPESALTAVAEAKPKPKKKAVRRAQGAPKARKPSSPKHGRTTTRRH